MANVLRWVQRSLLRPASPVRQYARSGFRTIAPVEKIEEETLPWYSPDTFFPVRIGEVFRSRYQVLGKLGYGAYSTVWLCRDLRGQRYVAMKVCERNSTQGQRELEVYRHLNSLASSSHHVGSTLVRTVLDSFDMIEPKGRGRYLCLIHKPLGMSLAGLRARARERKLPEDLLKLTLIHIFHALDFLHSDANVIHTDLQEKNIMLSIEDHTILSRFETVELENPSPRKIDGERIIYKSRDLRTPKTHGRPVLCDFGEARMGSTLYHEDIQPYLYRAPEVLLRMKWNNKVDIWNLGVLIWDLFENKHLFNARDETGKNSNLHHLAEMIALLGPPPEDFLARSEFADEVFDSQGHWKGAIGIPAISLEDWEVNLDGSQKDLFITFVRKMLQWAPERRSSAEELLNDPWLRSN